VKVSTRAFTSAAMRAPFGSIRFPESSVKGTQTKVTGFASDFENQTIGEPERGTATIVLTCHGHDIGVLDRQVSVMQKA
jgi:hypothetical protein